MRLITKYGMRQDRPIPLSELWLTTMRHRPRAEITRDCEEALVRALQAEHKKREEIRFGKHKHPSYIRKVSDD